MLIKIFSLVLSLVNSLAIIFFYFAVREKFRQPDLAVRTVRAERVFLRDDYTNGYIELKVDDNGPLLTVSNAQGHKATIGAVPVDKGFGTGRTKYPAYAISNVNNELMWIEPLEPKDDNMLEIERVTGRDEERVENFMEIMSSLKWADPKDSAQNESSSQ